MSKYKKSNKAALEMDIIGWWVIAIIVLAVVVLGLLVLRGKGVGAMSYLKNIFSLGV